MWRFGAITGTVIDEAGEPLVGVRVSAFRRTVVAGNRRFGGRTAATTDDRGMYRLGNLVPGEYVVGMLARPMSVSISQARGFRLSPQSPSSTTVMQIGDAAYVFGRGVPIPPPPSGGRLFLYPPTFYPSTSGQPTAVAVASGEERTAIDLQFHAVASARVSGTVAGPAGPAAGIELLLVPAELGEVPFEEEGSTTQTDGTGAFRFAAVPAGQYSIRTLPFASGGRTTEPRRWADVAVTVGSTDVDGVAVVLQPGLRISGRIDFEGSGERPDAQRLQQVPIVIEPAVVPSVTVRPGPTRIDASAAFTTSGLPPGRYFVRVRDSPVGWMFKSATYDGRNVADVPLDLQSGDATNVVITFTDRWTGFRGTVQSADGMRNDEAAVLLFPTDPQGWSGYGQNPRRLKSARTTKMGEYSFSSVPAGDYYMIALPDEQAADWQDAQFLETLARVATQVTIADGEQKAQHLRMRGVR
jgi:hypothetical protein